MKSPRDKDPLEERLYDQQCVRDACAGLMLRALRDLTHGDRAAREWFLKEDDKDDDNHVTLDTVCDHLHFNVQNVRTRVKLFISGDVTSLNGGFKKIGVD